MIKCKFQSIFPGQTCSFSTELSKICMVLDGYISSQQFICCSVTVIIIFLARITFVVDYRYQNQSLDQVFKAHNEQFSSYNFKHSVYLCHVTLDCACHQLGNCGRDRFYFLLPVIICLMVFSFLPKTVDFT